MILIVAWLCGDQDFLIFWKTFEPPPLPRYNSNIMQIQSNVSLKDYSTMRIGGKARALTTVTSKDELVEAVDWAKTHNLPLLILGGGSNVIFSNGFEGLVIINRIGGYKVLEETSEGATICAGAGENWDVVVARTIDANLHGIELLSGIPGTTGATPVQNVGAYGAEIADTLQELEAYDLRTKEFVTLQKNDCGFTYRNSIFKSPKKRRYIITSITLKLTKKSPKPPFYHSLQHYLDERGISKYTPMAIREAVLDVRSRRLPDPAKIANTGSFFKNPIVNTEVAERLEENYPDLAFWPLQDGKVKLAAGWLLEKAGLRGYSAHGMKTYEHHALVLVNDHAKDYDDLLKFKQEIIDAVQDKFGVMLEQEPELM